MGTHQAGLTTLHRHMSHTIWKIHFTSPFHVLGCNAKDFWNKEFGIIFIFFVQPSALLWFTLYSLLLTFEKGTENMCGRLLFLGRTIPGLCVVLVLLFVF